MKNTQVRRITAERLLQSKTTIPHYYLTVDLNADKLLELRSQLNERLAASGGKLSLNDFIVKASALVRLHRQPADLCRAFRQTSAIHEKRGMRRQCPICRQHFISYRSADAADSGQSWQVGASVFSRKSVVIK